jgi:transcriptional antiterminator Rof (Rho-off)
MIYKLDIYLDSGQTITLEVEEDIFNYIYNTSDIISGKTTEHIYFKVDEAVTKIRTKHIAAISINKIKSD